MQYVMFYFSLDYTNPVSNIQSIIILAQPDVTLLQTSRSDQCVNLFAFDIVKSFDGGLDLTFVGLNINNKNKSVAILDKFHG